LSRLFLLILCFFYHIKQKLGHAIFDGSF